MAQFTATVYQNEFLPDGGTDVNAIVTVTCSGAGEAGRGAGGQAGEIIIVDTSGSMGRTKIESAKIAASAAMAWKLAMLLSSSRAITAPVRYGMS